MATTLADIERALIARCGKLMAEVGMSLIVSGDYAPGSSEPAPANPDLADPIAWGGSYAGIRPAEGRLFTPQDDFSAADDDAIDWLIDYAEYRLLNNILGSYLLVDAKVGMGEVKWSQLRTAIQARLDRLGKELRLDDPLPEMEAGSIVRVASHATGCRPCRPYRRGCSPTW